MAYARGTTVPTEKSRMEIETIVKRYGATAFLFADRSDKAVIQFEARQRVVRFILPLPTPKECSVRRVGKTCRNVPINQQQGYREQLCRERWRALRLAIHAKLESVEAGIEQFEESFLGQIVDPSTNRTVYEHMKEPLALSYSKNPRPTALPSPEDIE